ncbi:molybdenum cofactor guanylyltransferase [Paenibacillus macerans]|uniref:molybdenum cofactor guanylyltransferase n=1 Tax=Paenibacillus macerans TaxID=44252 RepID=UPI003D320345
MDATAIIIAGGRSSRMGSDKALLELGGLTVLERLIRELEPLASRIIIAAGDKEVYGAFGKEVVADLYPGAGPLAGLHAGLTSSASLWSMAVACDTPFANRGLFGALLERAAAAESGAAGAFGTGGTEAVIARTEGRVHPLLAVYRRSVLPGLERRLQAGNLKMTAWTDALKAEYAEGETLAAASGLPQEWCAFNMNRPEDYDEARAWLGESSDPA